MELKSRLLLSTVFFSAFSFSQQRVGAEISSRFQDLSLTLTFQKVVAQRFLLGAGFIWNGKATGYSENYHGAIHNPFTFVPNTHEYNGAALPLKNYNSTSDDAIGIQLMTGYFKEISPYHGLRFNLNLRLSRTKTFVTGYYEMSNGTDYIRSTRGGVHSFQAISPELYHVIRQSDKWSFYYGIRLPIYTSLIKSSYDPIYNTDLYHGVRFEVAIGLSRHVGKPGEERLVPPRKSEMD